MELLNELKNISNSTDFIETKNFYYEYHTCSKSGEKEKIMLDFTLKNDTSDKILRFGMCSKCGLCCYHNDFNAKDF